MIIQSEKCKARYKNGYNFAIHQAENEIDIQGFWRAMGMDNGKKVTLPSKDVNFSTKQLECLNLLSKGYCMKEIARILALSHRTLETHLNRIKEKTGFNYKSQLIRLYQTLYS